jgi:hypothetical protein
VSAPAPVTATQAVAVVVPARDEEDGIGGCIGAIAEAAAHPALAGVPVHLMLVLDDCRDATAVRAQEALRLAARSAAAGSLLVNAVSVSLANVGRARALGVALAVAGMAEAHKGVGADAVWLATTDADSVVPRHWLAHQLELRMAGADGYAGTVIVDSWAEHPDRTRRRFERRYHGDGSGFGHPHVHGTNLGLSLAAYLAVGGFAPLETGEDRALWDALGAAGRRLVSTPLAPVVTSGRRWGRSPGGFAALLRQLGTVPA